MAKKVTEVEQNDTQDAATNSTVVVFETGGKQYKVAVGTQVQVETLEGKPGDTITFDKVLLVSDGANHIVGTPHVEGAKVSAQLMAHDRSKKVTIFKKRRRKGYTKKQGHRQNYTEVKILEIHA